MTTRVCISGCCWCGRRVDAIQQSHHADAITPPLFATYPLVTCHAQPCGHQVQGDIVKRDDGPTVITVWKPWEQPPHMHPAETPGETEKGGL
jgi:hypothetical protein